MTAKEVIAWMTAATLFLGAITGTIIALQDSFNQDDEDDGPELGEHRLPPPPPPPDREPPPEYHRKMEKLENEWRKQEC